MLKFKDGLVNWASFRIVLLILTIDYFQKAKVISIWRCGHIDFGGDQSEQVIHGSLVLSPSAHSVLILIYGSTVRRSTSFGNNHIMVYKVHTIRLFFFFYHRDSFTSNWNKKSNWSSSHLVKPMITQFINNT